MLLTHSAANKHEEAARHIAAAALVGECLESGILSHSYTYTHTCH
jgi:hypothetical protein